MYYRNFSHQETYLELIYDTQKGNSNEYVSAFYILTLPEIYDVAIKHIKGDFIDFDSIINNEWSDSMLFLLKVAKSLFTSKGRIDITDFLYLDIDDYNVFREAMDLRYDNATMKKQPIGRPYALCLGNSVYRVGADMRIYWSLRLVYTKVQRGLAKANYFKKQGAKPRI